MSVATTLEPKLAVEPLDNGESLYEVVNGQRVELPPMSILASLLASRLFSRIDWHVTEKRLGIAVCEALFVLDAVRNIRRRPDVAFVSTERWPLDQPVPDVGDWQVVPDLAIEVISPNDLFESVLEKIDEYFTCGVRQVWVVLPRDQKALIYSTPQMHYPVLLGDELDGGTIVPGFRLKLAELFKNAVANV